MVATNIWFWIGFVAFVLAMLALDLGVFNRRPHDVHPKEAMTWTAVWVGLALLFAGGLAFFATPQVALTFLTGYLIEESLSIDNIFVIVLIFQYFAVPAQYQHRVLFWGILGALVMRGLFIGLGAALLVVTGVRMALKQDEEFDGDQNPVVKAVRRILPLTDGYRGKHFFAVENGRRYATPLLLVLMLVEATDLIFAIDSIPAIFGITRDPFIVFTSNIFAVMGLRSLFFLLAHVVTKFHLLKYGLAVILTFVGVKMIIEPWVHIPILLSLAVVLGVLLLSIVASLIWPKAYQPSEGKTGSMFGRLPPSS
jgi:tellurite resistance protein TerC